MATDTWTEIRTAYHVARLGTVSAAADAIGVHHATVIRHIDALESRFGTKLFHRHARGYTPTEAGLDLLSVGQAADEQFLHLAGRIRGQGEQVSGELVVTTVPGVGDLVVPALARFQAEHPDLRVNYISDQRRLRLEFGEAHIAIRGGKRPEEPDNIVQPLFTFGFGLFAARSYVEQHGLPQSLDDLGRHRFVGMGDYSRAPFNLWLQERVLENIVFTATHAIETVAAIAAGVGIGFLRADADLSAKDLVRVLPDVYEPEWTTTVWIVTHIATHRTAKVQRAVAHLRREAQDWQSRCTKNCGKEPPLKLAVAG